MKKFAFKHGIVVTTEHPSLLNGQVVEIIEELENHYRVRVFINGKPEEIEKTQVLVN